MSSVCGYHVPRLRTWLVVGACGMANSDFVRDDNAETSQELLRRARDGNAEARDRLYERYLPSLCRFASGRLPVGARDLVETGDVVQEVAIRALNRLDDFSPEHPGALMAYLRQAILNRIRDEARRARRHPMGAEPASDPPDRGASPVEVAIGREAEQRYEAALARLEPRDREAIIARIELGLDYEQAAEALGKPSADAARMQIARALLRLAREMRER
jgi:RNA polymerase sigma-70 factor, ECF subfamily